MHDNDNFGPSLTGVKAQEIRKGLLRATAMAFLAVALFNGDLAIELVEITLLGVFGSQRAFTIICRIIKRGK